MTTLVNYDRDFSTVEESLLTSVTINFDQNDDGIAEAIDVAAVDISNDGTIDLVDSPLNGIGTFDLVDLIEPNESTIINNIAYGEDYSITVKDDGKLSYRFGTIVNRPNDIRLELDLELPERMDRRSERQRRRRLGRGWRGLQGYPGRADRPAQHHQQPQRPDPPRRLRERGGGRPEPFLLCRYRPGRPEQSALGLSGQ